MPDVTLVLRANNSDQIAKMKESQKETQKVYDIAEKGSTKQKGLIEREIQMQKQLGESRNKATNIDNLKIYNGLLDDSEKRLNGLKNAGIETEKQTTSLTQSIGKWALSLGGVVAVAGALKTALMQLTVVIDAANVVGAVYKQVMYNIVTSQNSWIQGIGDAIKIQNTFNHLRFEGYKEGVEVQKLETIYQQKYSAAISEVTDNKKKLLLIDEALAAHNKAIDIQQRDAIKLRDAYLSLNLNQKGNEESVKGYYAALQEIDRLDAERVSSTRRLVLQRANIIKDAHDKSIKAWYDEIEQQNKLDDAEYDRKLKYEEDYQKALNAVIDKYNSLNIESKTGVDKLKAQRDFAINEIDILKTHLLNFGPLSEDQQNMILKMVDDVQKVFIKGMEKEAKVTPSEKNAISKALLAGMPTMDDLAKGPAFTKPTKPLTSIWQLMGIDPESEDGKKAIEALKKGAEVAMKAITDVMQKRVEDAQRNRELLDTKISEAETELNTETELYKAGYASNVAAKQKELAALKIQRDAALKQEQDAVKKQRALDTVTQVSSLITASADIFKSLAKIPVVGIPLAIGVIAAMFGAFAAAKTSASKLAFAKGGWTGDGSYRDETGERVAGTVHEREFVVKRGQAGRYRSLLEAINKDDKRMILHTFNKLSPELLGGTTNVIVENEGPNNRLDQLIIENKKLNAKLSGESIQHFGGVQIIKKGNSIRTIRV